MVKKAIGYILFLAPFVALIAIVLYASIRDGILAQMALGIFVALVFVVAALLGEHLIKD